MLHLKMYVQKMYYSSTMPSRKQSHYRYQNENLHLLPQFGHVFFNSHQILSPNLGHTTKSPYTFFLYCESWVVPLQLTRAGTITGSKLLGLESPYQLDPFKRPFIFYSLWQKLCYKDGLGLALFGQTQNLLGLFLKGPAWNRSVQPSPGHPQHTEGMSPWGI